MEERSSGNTLSVNETSLRELNHYFFSPNDNYKFPGERRGGIQWFQRAWCRRQKLVEMLRRGQDSWHCLNGSTETLKDKLWSLMRLFDGDRQYLNDSICAMVEEQQLRVNAVSKNLTKQILRTESK